MPALGWGMAWAIALGLGIAFAAPPAQAQGRGGVCFFEHADYQGREFCAEAGRDVPFVGPGANDQFSSVRIAPGLAVTMCEHANFGGRCVTLDRSTPLFRGFNDQVSSFRVEGGFERPAPPRYRGREQFDAEDGSFEEERPRRRREVQERGDQVCFFSEPQFEGERVCVPAGGLVADLRRRGLNDALNSVLVPPGLSVIVCEHVQFDGECARFDRSVPQFGRRWSDRISSVRVEE